MAKAMARAGITAEGEYATATDSITSTTKFLSNITPDQAKAIIEGSDEGEGALYAMIAAALPDDALRGMQVKFGDRYTADFVELARKTMSTDNPALSAIFSGEAWTLNEVLDELGGKNDQFSREKLRNFATAIHTSIEGLENYRDALGTLTYADLMADTGELEKKFNDLGGILNTVADSTQSVSEWMTTITTKYPDLMQYMSDTPTLMEKLVEKMSDINNQVMRQQFQEYMNSRDFWKSTIRGGENGIEALLKDNPAALDWLNAQNITNTQELVDLLQALPTMREGETKDAMMAVYNALNQAIEGTDITLRGDAFTGLTQQFTAWIAQTMRTEISALEAQRDALEKVNKQRRYEVDLLNAQNKLQDALNEKKRIYRAGVGFVYEADQKAIKEAKEGLEEVKREKDISAITKQIETLNEEATRWETYWDTRTKENQETLFTKIWGPDNMDSFRTALFGGSNVDMKTILMGNNNGGSLASAIWGAAGDKNSWWEKTFGTSTGSLKDFFTGEFLIELDKKLNGDGGSGGGEEDERVTRVKKAYEKMTALKKADQAGYDVNVDEWNTALAEFKSAYDAAYNARLINDEWDYNYGTYGFDGKTVISWGSPKALAARVGELRRSGPEPAKEPTWFERWVSENSAAQHNYVETESFPLIFSDGFAEYVEETLGGQWGKRGVMNVYKAQKEAVDAGTAGYLSIPEEIKQLYRTWSATRSSAPSVPNTLSTNSSGTLNLVPSLINELGTEAIITPAGTLTALPSHSGIVPADITKNLWALGEVAPSLLRLMGGPAGAPKLLANALSGTDESININNLQMEVNADETFDVDAFVTEIKQRVALTKHTR